MSSSPRTWAYRVLGSAWHENEARVLQKVADSTDISSSDIGARSRQETECQKSYSESRAPRELMPFYRIFYVQPNPASLERLGCCECHFSSSHCKREVNPHGLGPQWKGLLSGPVLTLPSCPAFFSQCYPQCFLLIVKCQGRFMSMHTVPTFIPYCNPLSKLRD